MDRRTLIVLAGTIAVVMVFVAAAAVASGGLGRARTTVVRVALEEYGTAQNRFEVDRKAIESALESEPDLFRGAGFLEAWPAKIADAKQRLTTAETAAAAARAGLEANDPETWGELEKSVESLQASTNAVNAVMAEMRAEADKRIQFKQNREKTVESLRSLHTVVTTLDFTGVEAQVRRASADWPDKKSDLERRLGAAKALVPDAQRAWKTVQEQDAKFTAGAEDFDIDRFVAAAESLQQVGKLAKPSISRLEGLVDQLYVSWDQVLADMEISEGADVTFRHLIRTIRSRADAKEGDAPPQPTEEWKTVDKRRYEQLKNDLGMVVAHKPAGKYENEAENRVQPPGYAYMCSPDEKRNRYGYWENRGGSSFWVWYGQYAFFSNLFYGPGWYRSHPFDSGDYRGYRRARNAGRTYYGSSDSGKQRFGSSGSATKTKYSSSKYVRADGYKSTKYVKSGGTYRGSRFERRTSSRSSRSSSSFRSSSRRSSSRFGFGK